MKKACKYIIGILSLCIAIMACRFFSLSQAQTVSPVLTLSPFEVTNIPTGEPTHSVSFGDGYIARVPIDDHYHSTPEQIVQALVTQWLEHYKSGSKVSTATIKDFALGRITFLDNQVGSGFDIVAGVKFSIIPTQIPNDWASFPGDAISPNDVWCHMGAPFGILKEGEYFILKLVFGWGT